MYEDSYIVRDAISRARSSRGQKILLFASASNFGGGKHELFPARDSQVFSIRSTDHFGKHSDFNASLPEEPGVKVFGTLGEKVPTAQRGSTQLPITRTGTSPATAIAAALAALILGYINAFGADGVWDRLRTQDGYQRLLYGISTEPEAQKRFVTLDDIFHDTAKFEALLNVISVKSQTQ
jgi:hypothetical protein